MAGPGGAASVAENAAPETYDVTVTGVGLDLRRSVTQDVALRVVTVLMSGGEVPPPGFGPPSHSGGRRPHKAADSGTRPPDGDGSSLDDHDEVPESVGEFLERVEARRNPDKITAIAYFLRQRGTQLFTREDIKAQFERAGEPMPGNYGRDWRWTLSSKWIATSSDDPDKFYLTRLGRNAVEAHFSDEVRKPLQQQRTPRRSSGQNGEKSEENGDQA